jgi:hypothetical protein
MDVSVDETERRCGRGSECTGGTGVHVRMSLSLSEQVIGKEDGGGAGVIVGMDMNGRTVDEGVEKENATHLYRRT